jgi:hypothetical protein
MKILHQGQVLGRRGVQAYIKQVFHGMTVIPHVYLGKRYTKNVDENTAIHNKYVKKFGGNRNSMVIILIEKDVSFGQVKISFTTMPTVSFVANLEEAIDIQEQCP